MRQKSLQSYFLFSFVPLIPLSFVKVNKMYILLWNHDPCRTLVSVSFSPQNKSFCCDFYSHIWMGWSFPSSGFFNKDNGEIIFCVLAYSNMHLVFWLGIKFLNHIFKPYFLSLRILQAMLPIFQHLLKLFPHCIQNVNCFSLGGPKELPFIFAIREIY